MPRTKTTFKNYSAARAFVRKLKLRTMQDWINFSKGKDPEGRIRPKDIPSNPWTVYAPVLAAQGKKFSINEFLGSQKKVNKKVVDSEKKKRIRKVSLSDIPVQLADAIVSSSKQLTYAKSKAVLKRMHVRSQADFNALARMKLLPKQLPKKPSEAYKTQWKGWKSFLGVRTGRA